MAHVRTARPEILPPLRQSGADTVDIEHLSRLLDSQYAIPGTNIRFGLDSIIGLIPGIGDAVTTAMGAYIIYRAHQLGAPKPLLARMVLNLTIDGVVGAIPIFGDLFDFAFRANLKNVRMLLRHLEQTGRR